MHIYNHITENLRNTMEWVREIVEDSYDVTPEEKAKLQAIQTDLKDLLEGLEQ